MTITKTGTNCNQNSIALALSQAMSVTNKKKTMKQNFPTDEFLFKMLVDEQHRAINGNKKEI